MPICASTVVVPVGERDVAQVERRARRYRARSGSAASAELDRPVVAARRCRRAAGRRSCSRSRSRRAARCRRGSACARGRRRPRSTSAAPTTHVPIASTTVRFTSIAPVACSRLAIPAPINRTLSVSGVRNERGRRRAALVAARRAGASAPTAAPATCAVCVHARRRDRGRFGRRRPCPFRRSRPISVVGVSVVGSSVVGVSVVGRRGGRGCGGRRVHRLRRRSRGRRGVRGVVESSVVVAAPAQEEDREPAADQQERRAEVAEAEAVGEQPVARDR